MATTALFLLVNGHVLLPSSAEMVRFAVEVAESEPDMGWQDVAAWIRQNTIRIRGNRRQTIELVRETFDNPNEIIERLTGHWPEIAAFLRE